MACIECPVEMMRLISDEILAMKNYNDEAKAVTWADSSLRSWLNDDFFNYAFGRRRGGSHSDGDAK